MDLCGPEQEPEEGPCKRTKLHKMRRISLLAEQPLSCLKRQLCMELVKTYTSVCNGPIHRPTSRTKYVEDVSISEIFSNRERPKGIINEN
jgi:hypothetical protein